MLEHADSNLLDEISYYATRGSNSNSYVDDVMVRHSSSDNGEDLTERKQVGCLKGRRGMQCLNFLKIQKQKVGDHSAEKRGIRNAWIIKQKIL